MARGKRSRAREEEEAGTSEAAKDTKQARKEEEEKGEEVGKANGSDMGEGRDIRESAEIKEEETRKKELGGELHLPRCKAILQLLLDHKYAWLFSEPVDPVALEIPDYPSVIKHPMDLGTIMEKLEKKEYIDPPLDFIQDVRLTFDNAMLYNPPGHDVHTSAKKMLAFFEKEWNKSAARSSAASTPRTPRQAMVSTKVFSFEDKQDLLDDLQTLPSDMQHAAVLLLKERSPLVDWSGDEVDVQLDLLDNQLLQELEDHVKQCMARVASSDKKVKQASGSSKSSGKRDQRKGKGKVDEEEDIGFVIDIPLSLFIAQRV